ncbi:Uncharacterised protein [Vibrio cholerae]|nr:Uncharacterised protein [Vibrio cholerae]
MHERILQLQWQFVAFPRVHQQSNARCPRHFQKYVYFLTPHHSS